ncbi:4Fe-4S single cluster domain-containing protein [Microbacterium sp. H1-D42]|uniref:4Fe-4S single cluster domain-containing protein n=1 Tax=Microbacterium sp. H1-D42 TaxID=2925844 RepID=UPI001F53B54B|nr:4Fe-4S single cluster domain-containing protein [Microbacterium sp. H1-D42]UNK72234.1 radical SAM protein [Microbacterium sp. H1-D42]
MIVHAQSPGVEVPTLLGTVEPAPAAGPLRWSRFLPATEAEGPGRRAALWVQGCRVHCPECFNPQLWATRGGVLSDPVTVAAEWVDTARAAGATGITLLGGEPFEQAAALAPIAHAFRDAGMTVMAFSGHTLPDLERWSADRADIAALLDATDLLCDGPYLREHPDTRRPWIGSTNQGIRALTPAHADEVRRIASDGRRDTLEVRIGPDGLVSVNGWASDAALSALFDDLGVRADRPQERVA